MYYTESPPPGPLLPGVRGRVGPSSLLPPPSSLTNYLLPVNRNPDFLIIGGGIIGLNLALHAKARYPGAGILERALHRFDNFRPGEMSEVVFREALFFLRNDFSFRRLAFREIMKYSRRRMVRAAGELRPAWN